MKNIVAVTCVFGFMTCAACIDSPNPAPFLVGALVSILGVLWASRA